MGFLLRGLGLWGLGNKPTVLFTRAAITRDHRWGAETTDINFLTVLETRSSRSKFWQDWFLMRSLPGLQMATFSLCGHMAFPLWTRREKERKTEIWSFSKATSPFWIKAPTSWPRLTLITLLKAQLQMGLGLQHMNLGVRGDTNQSLTATPTNTVELLILREQNPWPFQIRVTSLKDQGFLGIPGLCKTGKTTELLFAFYKKQQTVVTS